MDRQETWQSPLRWRLASLRVRAAMLRLSIGVKAGFRPDQPRVPRGHPDGGQWTRTPGYAQVHRVSRRRGGGGQIRIGGRWHPITPAQEVRLQISAAAMKNAVQRVRQIDRDWRSQAQAYATVEGQIRANEAIRLQAELRLYELTGRPIRLGPFAHEWITLAPGQMTLTAQQRRLLDAIGQRYGCHGCGSTENLTRNGHFVGDHQIPRALGRSTIVIPHCVHCSNIQGGYVGALRGRLRK